MKPLALAAAILLNGCAAVPYWIKTHDALPVENIIELDKPEAICGNPPHNGGLVYGCMIRQPGYATIYIKKGLPADQHACVLAHELAHAQGWSHDLRPAFRPDCGPT